MHFRKNFRVNPFLHIGHQYRKRKRRLAKEIFAKNFTKVSKCWFSFRFLKEGKDNHARLIRTVSAPHPPPNPVSSVTGCCIPEQCVPGRSVRDFVYPGFCVPSTMRPLDDASLDQRNPHQWALTKKKIKFSSYIRKFRYERLQSHMRKCANSKSYMRRPLVIYDFATAPFWISLYVMKILFSFWSVSPGWCPKDAIS